MQKNPGSHTDGQAGLVLANGHVRLEFEAGGGMGLCGMTDLHTGQNHIRPVEGKHLLWEVAMGVGRQVYTITNNYKPCTRAAIEELPGGGKRAVLEWDRLRWWLEDGAVSVVVTVELKPDDGVADWRIRVRNGSDYWGLWAVLFPIVNGFPSSGEYDIARPVFAGGGHLLKACAERISARYPGATWPMQFLSFNRGRDAVYLATRDPDARAKDFVVEPVRGLTGERFPVVYEGRRHRVYVPEPGERVYVAHYAENMGVKGSDYPDPYPVAFGVYQGGWLEAALRYRPWALAQKWAAKGPVSRRADIPQRIKDTALWVRDVWEWQGATGTPSEMNRPLLDAARELGVPLGLQWYRWHETPFDNNYPHFLPAKEKFKERVDELTKAGVLVMPYINGSSADMNIPDWADFEPHAAKDEAGGLRLHFYSDRAGRLISMCAHQAFWRDAIAGVVEDIFAQHGVGGIYIDQVAGLYHELCFDRGHGHPLGGGRYWVDGNRELLRKVKEVVHRAGREGVMTSEGATEVFLDVLDANLMWSDPSDREIPMMPVVYAGYTLFFGSPCDYRRSEDYFAFAQGQAFLDGRQCGWMDFGLFRPEHARKVQYLKRIGQYRVACRDFLTYGRLWGPVAPAAAVPTFREERMGWAMYEQPRAAELPAAEGRLWQAEDGRLAVAIANYVDREVDFAYGLDPARYGLTAGRYRLTEVSPEGRLAAGEVDGEVRRTERLGPRSLRVIEIAARREA